MCCCRLEQPSTVQVTAAITHQLSHHIVAQLSREREGRGGPAEPAFARGTRKEGVAARSATRECQKGSRRKCAGECERRQMRDNADIVVVRESERTALGGRCVLPVLPHILNRSAFGPFRWTSCQYAATSVSKQEEGQRRCGSRSLGPYCEKPTFVLVLVQRQARRR